MDLARWIVAGAVLAACGRGSLECGVHGDCVTGERCVAHACVALDAGDVPDAVGDELPDCVPNHDGVIERDEVVILVPARAKFRTSDETEVDLAGSQEPDGTRRWDFSGMLTGDRDVVLGTEPLADRWYAAEFPAGQFVTPLDDVGDTELDGIYAATPEALEIHGAASVEDGYSSTKLSYEPVLAAMRFPLQIGRSWEGRSRVSGTVGGAFVTFEDAYRTEADARGSLMTPYGDFPVLRLRLELTRTAGFARTTMTTYAFVAECYGTVASVVSRPNEPPGNTEFQRARTVRRLAP